MFSLLYIITSWYQNNEHENNLNLSFTEKDLSIESRKILIKLQYISCIIQLTIP